MNWKAEAAQRLRNLPTGIGSTQVLEQEICRLETLLRAPGYIRFDAPVCTSRDKDARLDQMMSLQALRTRLDQAQKWVQVTQSALESLTEQERDILYWLFISPRKGGAEQLCQQLEVERSSVYRRRDKALEKFALALYGPDL